MYFEDARAVFKQKTAPSNTHRFCVATAGYSPAPFPDLIPHTRDMHRRRTCQRCDTARVWERKRERRQREGERGEREREREREMERDRSGTIHRVFELNRTKLGTRVLYCTVPGYTIHNLL